MEALNKQFKYAKFQTLEGESLVVSLEMQLEEEDNMFLESVLNDESVKNEESTDLNQIMETEQQFKEINKIGNHPRQLKRF